MILSIWEEFNHPKVKKKKILLHFLLCLILYFFSTLALFFVICLKIAYANWEASLVGAKDYG